MMEKTCSLGNNVVPIPNISQNRRRERKKEREVAEHLGKLHSTVLKSLRKLHDLLHPPFTMTRARTVRKSDVVGGEGVGFPPGCHVVFNT